MVEGSPVDQLYQDFLELMEIIDVKEVTLRNRVSAHFSKSLFIAAASYFEGQIEWQVLNFVQSDTARSEFVKELVLQKAFGRNYHSLFNWNVNNVNGFFSLFGSAFSNSMKQYVKDNKEYEDGIRAFLEIGVARNKIAHKEYFQFPIDSKATEEIYSSYQTALLFVDSIGSHLEKVSAEVSSGLSPG